VAKTTKSGLGRGLNSLISGSAEEALPAVVAQNEGKNQGAAPIRATTERNLVVFEDENTEPVLPQKPETTKRPTTQAASKGQEGFSFEKPPETVVGAGVNQEDSPFGQSLEPPKPYFEEDDHVVIKSVEARAADEIPISSIKPNPDQPRTNFKQEELEELAASIEKEGLLQPILVRAVGKSYQIIAGERRWQACRMLGMKTIPVRIREADDDKALELALIENLHREDLNPIEEAYGYRRLMDRRGLTHSELAELVSKGRSTVANSLRLLELPEEAQQLLFEEKISAGHARAILSIPTQAGRMKLTERMIKEKISVREAETIARLFAGGQNKAENPQRPPIPKSYKVVARALRDVLKTDVRVRVAQGKSKIEIEFKDEEDLERLFDIMTALDIGLD